MYGCSVESCTRLSRLRTSVSIEAPLRRVPGAAIKSGSVEIRVAVRGRAEHDRRARLAEVTRDGIRQAQRTPNRLVRSASHSVRRVLEASFEELVELHRDLHTSTVGRRTTGMRLSSGERLPLSRSLAVHQPELPMSAGGTAQVRISDAGGLCPRRAAGGNPCASRLFVLLETNGVRWL